MRGIFSPAYFDAVGIRLIAGRNFTADELATKAPVLVIHGLNDTALLPGALNNTWDWLEKDLTLVTIPGAGHFVQQDASDLVTRSMKMWLNR